MHDPERIQPRLEYRPDVDGLRALAVVAVVLFHADVPGFTGGYVGVDVFFVISGYLITQRVIDGVEDGTFSFWQFYAKRVRRLLPAAATTILATLAVGVVMLPPAGLRLLAQSVAAAATSVSNIWFWSQSGYWDTEATTKPLLHTWSLAVEEQFYLVWPLLIVALVVWRRRRALVPLLAIGVVSLAATAWMTAVEPSAAFYLTPFRAYEFVAGGALVWLDRVIWPTSRAGRTLQAMLWTAGIAAIAMAVAVYDDTTAFPGVAAAVPSVGAAAVIAARRPARLDGVLANRATVHVGLTSYSLYLLHWPTLVFARQLTGTLDGPTVAGALAVTVVLTELQYRFVERRFRWGSAVRAPLSGRQFRRVAAPALIVSLAVAVGGCTVAAMDGLPGRYDDTIRELAIRTIDDFKETRADLRTQLCGEDQPPLCGEVDPSAANVLVIGDSHAADGLNVAAAAVPDANLLLSAHGGCPPVMDLQGITHSYKKCGQFNAQRFAVIEDLAGQLDAVLVSSRLDAERVDGTVDLVRWLEHDVGVVAVVLGQGPFYETDARDLIVAAGSLARADQAVSSSIIEEIFEADRRLEEEVPAAGGVYLDKLDWMCPDRTCRGFVPGTTNLLVFDRHHLTRTGGTNWGLHVSRELAAAIS